MPFTTDRDDELFGLIDQEVERQTTTIQLIASENFTSPAVMEATGSVFTNKYSEGYPGKRYYGGNQVVDEVKTHFQQLVFDTVIHRNVSLGEAPSHGQTIIMHDASSKGATNYLNLAREILQKNDLTRIREAERTIATAEVQ